MAQAHTLGGPVQLSVQNHRSVGQLFKTIGADPKNEVMIFTGTGDDFMMDSDPNGFALEEENVADWAYVIADHIMTQPRITRRLTTQIIRRPWRQRLTDDLDGGFGIQMFAHVAKKKAVHSRQHIGKCGDYVRNGGRNNFDR